MSQQELRFVLVKFTGSLRDFFKHFLSHTVSNPGYFVVSGAAIITPLLQHWDHNSSPLPLFNTFKLFQTAAQKFQITVSNLSMALNHPLSNQFEIFHLLHQECYVRPSRLSWLNSCNSLTGYFPTPVGSVASLWGLYNLLNNLSHQPLCIQRW